MHTGPVPGTYTSEWESTSIACPSCTKREVRRRTWESDCGGYEDHKFKCTACGHTWWIESDDG